VRFAVDAWDPDYGASFDDALAEANVTVDAEVERLEGEWSPMRVTHAPPLDLLRFVDGVRRVEANVWVTAPDGTTRHGICASYAAGVVRCDGRAIVEDVRVERAVFCHPDGAEPITTRHGRFALHAVPDVEKPGALTLALQGAMSRLEVEVAGTAGNGSVVVVDGPLRDGQLRPGFAGFVKTHRTRYGPPVVAGTVARLAPGERTPLLCLGGPRPRYSWYLRLPGPVEHAWSGVVRLEIAADATLAEAVAQADRLAIALPPFGSTPHKDSRAPQNLFPIAGLERDLRRRLGDPALMLRALRAAAAVAA
jgi:hypothetical protein